MFVVKMDTHDLYGTKNGFVAKLRKTIYTLAPRYKVVPPTAFLRNSSSTKNQIHDMINDKEKLDYFIHKWEMDVELDLGEMEILADDIVILDELSS